MCSKDSSVATAGDSRYDIHCYVFETSLEYSSMLEEFKDT
jgi:hypothetical protein